MGEGGRSARGCVWQTPPGRHPPGQTPLFPVHAGIHTPPAHCMLGYMPPPPSGHFSRPYASYWNAFLLSTLCSRKDLNSNHSSYLLVSPHAPGRGGGVCAPKGGVSASGPGWGVSAPRGCLPLVRGVYPSMQ